MKLELKHIAPYLPYELQMAYIVNDKIVEIGSLDKVFIYIDEIYQIRYGINNNDVEHEWMFKPILRPLDSITEAEARSFLKLAHGGLINSTEVNIDTIDKDDLYLSSELSDGTIVCLRANHTLDGLCISIYSIATNDNTTTYPTPLFIYNLFFKHHFDVFGLIDKGLAVEK